MDPITQSKILVSNINDIKNNIFEIARQLGVPVDQLVDLSPCSISKVLSNKICSLNLSKHIANLQANLDMLQKQQIPPQSGGYRYIVNPSTNRRVNINSKLGQKLIKKYSEHL
jgi:hypothetical protein